MSIKPIPDEALFRYCLQMARGASDKAWALRMYPSSIVVDIGCADGTTLKWARRNLRPDMIGIGYDNDPRMVKRAQITGPNRLYFTSDLQELKRLTNRLSFYHSKPVIVLLNSVLHEVGSYAEPSKVLELWDAIVALNPIAIAIRDMGMPSHERDDTEGIVPVYHQQFKQRWPNLVEEHDLHWGEPVDWADLHRLALHLFHQEDWKQEMKEDYFSYPPDSVHQMLQAYGYRTRLFERFSIHHYCDWVMKEFGNQGNTQSWPIRFTHYRLLMVKKETHVRQD